MRLSISNFIQVFGISKEVLVDQSQSGEYGDLRDWLARCEQGCTCCASCKKQERAMALKRDFTGVVRGFLEVEGLRLVIRRFVDYVEEIRGVDSNIAGQSLNGEESC